MGQGGSPVRGVVMYGMKVESLGGKTWAGLYPVGEIQAWAGLYLCHERGLVGWVVGRDQGEKP